MRLRRLRERLAPRKPANAASAGNDQDATARFQKADKNGDKLLDEEEAKSMPAVAEQFKQIDTNGDGGISEIEFMAAVKGKTK